MASSGENVSLSDAEWLVMRARNYAKTDQWAAKAWLITARTLFPRSFLIQFESYQIEKSARNIKDAALHLEDMLKNFQHEASLWNEVQSILGALQKDSSETKTTCSFLTEIFAAIPTHVQCQMLLSVADKMEDVLERCRLLLLAMKKFPNLVREHGLKLVDMLIVEEGRSRVTSPVNCYRKLFVCDILPLVLQKNRPLTIPPGQLYSWLQRAVEFYISFITQPSTMDTPLSPDLMSPTKALCKKIVNIAGLLERESQIIDPWGSLFRLLHLVGSHVGWEMEADLFTKSRDYQLQYLLSLYNRSKVGANDEGRKQILYTCTILFLQCLYSYVSHVDSENFVGVFASTGLSAPVVLLEGFRLETDDLQSQSRVKRIRSDKTLPQIQAGPSIHNSASIIQNFLIALNCFELLHKSEDLSREFISLCQNWQMETWSWMGHFQTDMFLYQGSFQEAVAQIQSFIQGSKDKMKTRMTLQLGCCFYCLGNVSKACDVIMDTIENLETSDEEIKDISTGGQGRQLLLLQCIDSEILPFCIQLVISCIKEKAFSSVGSDILLGHLLVLLQYDWPKQDQLFSDTIKKIRKQGSFTYNLFFHYVFCIDILEEFALLDTQPGGKVNLDIMSVSTKIISQQRTVTRGLNKGVKEDFRASLEKQVQNLGEPIPCIIQRFLKDERETILKNL